MSSEQQQTTEPTPRRWSVELRFSGRTTIEVEAGTIDEAIEKACADWRDNYSACLDVEADCDEAKQVSGPPPEEAPAAVLTLHLADGRTLEIPQHYHDKQEWFPVTGLPGLPGEWWCNGQHAAMLAEPPAERFRSERPHKPDLSRAIPKVLRPASVSAERQKCSDGRTVCRLDGGDEAIWIDVRFLPLVCAVGGPDPWVRDDLSPVIGKRGDKVVAVVMPVRP